MKRTFITAFIATVISTIFLVPACNTSKPASKNDTSPMQKELQSVLEKDTGTESENDTAQSDIKVIEGLDELNSIVENTPGKLLVFDLYADWCMPCRILAPLYDSLSEAHSEKASFFRVDVQRHQDIAYAFKVQSIPLVVFIKDKEIVHAVTGLNPRNYYEKILTTCSNDCSAAECKEKLKKLL